MVKQMFIVFVLFPIFLFAGEFTASVTKKHVSLGDSFALQLTLKDASASSIPDTTPIKKNFHIRSQQQSSNTTIMNGRTSTSFTWTIILQPIKEGENLIPAIDIHTAEGVLTTSPIIVKVSPEAAPETKRSEADDIALSAEISTQHPYKNETFFLTVTLKSKIDLVNVHMPKFSIEEAIVATNGEPLIEKSIVDGIKLHVVTFNYLVTPLNAGVLHIPSITLEGAISVKRKTRSSSFFNDDLDPLFLMPGFNQLQSFVKASSPFTLNVQPAIAGMTPWLPARHLSIEESLDSSQKLEVGEPITRSIKINAEGILSSQLPDLTDRQNDDSSFKIYADKPVTVNEIKGETIHSYRLEQYTLIPQKPGNLTLPGITIEWWDIAKNQKAVSFLPGRTIEIQPKANHLKDTALDTSIESRTATAPSQDSSNSRDPLLYALIFGLAVLLLGAVSWVILLQKKLLRITSPQKTETPKTLSVAQSLKTTRKPAAKDKNEKLPDLNPT